MDRRTLKTLRRIRKSLEILAPYALDLECMCAIGAYFVTEKLKKLGYKAEMIEGHYRDDSHCWTRVGKFNIDLTATQFNSDAKKIYIFQKNKDYQEYKKIKHPGDLYGWPSDQKPYVKIIRELEEIYRRTK